jgi:4-hydroxy-tetrahydrodipicolinate synthase
MPDPRVARLRGLLTAIVTPFDLEGRLALEAMPALLEFQRHAGIDGVVVCGTNGEGTSLSVEERKRLLETVLEHRQDLTVIAGTGATSLTDALDLTRHAAEVGADAALVLPPFFFKEPTDEGLAAFFRPILDAADLPILLYNIPPFTAVSITDGVLNRLAGHPNLAGVKDSGGDWARTQALLANYPDLVIFPGSDYQAMQGYLAGAAGSISGGANPFPEIVAAVRDACRPDLAHKTEALSPEEAQARLTRMTDILRGYPLIAFSKSVLAHRGLPRLGVRPPLINLTPAQESSLIDELRAAGFPF